MYITTCGCTNEILQIIISLITVFAQH